MPHQVVFRAKVRHDESICNIIHRDEQQYVEQERIDGGGRHRQGRSFPHSFVVKERCVNLMIDEGSTVNMVSTEVWTNWG
jgi:hypothetical protein